MTYRLTEQNRRMLHASPWCGFGLCVIPPTHMLWQNENAINDRPVIAIPWTRVVIDRSSARDELVDPNCAVFYHAHQPYRRRLASPIGERCAFVNPSPELIRCALDEAGMDAPEGRFPFAVGPAVSWVTQTHHRLARMIGRSHPVSPIETETTLTEIVRRLVLSAADALRRRKPVRPDGTARAHRELVEHTRHEIGLAVVDERGAGSLGMVELARRVHSSPYHLCRVFKDATGMTIGMYTMRLRLRTAAEELAWSPRPIAEIAFQFGFSSHAHFTSAWKAEFGSPPSAVRKARI